jgi:hypothetical protein
MSGEHEVFSHSGDLGDVIAFLAPFQEIGGGELVLFPSHTTGYRMSPARAAALCPLIEAQLYIVRSQWEETSRGYNFDVWRCQQPWPKGITLAHMQARTLGVQLHPERAWLTATPKKVARVVISRGPRWRSNRFPWDKVLRQYRGELVYVGLPEEHQAFCDAWGDVPYQPTANFLEMAEVIAGAEMYVGSQSSPLWVAEGLKKLVIFERAMDHDNCWFSRPGQLFGLDHDYELPTLDEVERMAAEQAARVAAFKEQ